MFLDTFQREKPSELMPQLRAAFQKIGAAESLDALFESTLQEALLLSGAEIGSVFLVDEERQELFLKSGSGEYLSQFPRIRRSLHEGVLGYVASRRAPVWVQDTRKDLRFQNGNGFSGYHSRSFISIPILLHNELVGVLSLTDKKTKHPFSKRELEGMTLFAECLSVHVERLRIVGDRKRAVGDLDESRIEMIRLEEEKRRLASELELSQKMASIGKLAAGIAHELNNPLDGTLRYIHLSLSHLKEGDLVREYLLEVKQGLDRMTNIVKNLLAFSRRQRVALKPVEVNEIIETVLANLLDIGYPSRVEIIKAYHPVLPLLLDKGIDQIFTNIIKNAMEAMPQGGTLRIATLRGDHEILVRIADTGCGISKENRPLIFDPFFTTKEIDKGCGLGLAICYEIIQAYEGKIEVESEANRGATFLIHFPLKYTISKEAALSYAG